MNYDKLKTLPISDLKAWSEILNEERLEEFRLYQNDYNAHFKNCKRTLDVYNKYNDCYNRIIAEIKSREIEIFGNLR